MDLQLIALSRAMSEPGFYPHAPSDVLMEETNSSWVFLAGDRVYKLRKSVHFPFLDYSTPERRRLMAEREVLLGRGQAPGLYVGVLPVFAEEGTFSWEGEGTPVEWVVQMKRLSTHGRLTRVLERGEIDNNLMRCIARVVADHHGWSPTGHGIDHYGEFEHLHQVLFDDFAETEQHVGSCVGRRQWWDLREFVGAELSRHQKLLERRVRGGFIRAGHGDLRAEHIQVGEGGDILLFDRVEFNEGLRCCDVAAELAFLVMDFHHYGYHSFGRFLAREYAHITHDPDLLTLMPLYTVYRAWVRAKIAGIRCGLVDSDTERERARLEALGYYHVAWANSRRQPLVLLTYGLAGSGKSTLSRALAHRLGLHWLRSDNVHKRLQGVQPGERLETGFLSGAYTQEAKARTYVELLNMTADFVDRGEGVVVDASFGYPYMRDPFMHHIQEKGWDYAMVEIQIPADEAKRRLIRRAAEGTDPSDATWEIYLKQRQAFVPPTEIPRHIVLDGTTHVEDQISSLIESLLAMAGGGG